MSMRNGKADPGVLNGVGRSLNAAFAVDSPVDPELRQLINRAKGIYIPDDAADHRVSQLLERLKRLPWGSPRAQGRITE